MSSSEADKVAQMVGITGISEQMATQILTSTDWEVDQAVTNYYESLEGGDPDANMIDDDDEEEDEVPQTSSSRQANTNLITGGGRTLGGDTIPSSSTAAAPSQPKAKSSGKSKGNSLFKSFKDIRDRDDSDRDEDDEDKDQEFYAGGDKSGLAVREPNSGSGSGHNDQVKKLLETARRNGPPPARDAQQQASHFSGAAQTLGGDDTPSEVIPDPNATTRRATPMVERTLHLWEDGFSIDDGDLYRYDDPRNRHTLEMINRGSAPLDLMDVAPGQAVDVRLDEHRGEKYVQPQKKYKPFGGSGQRLGSPVPGGDGAAKSPPATTTTTSSTSASASSSTPSTMQIDDSQPTISLQIRLADGSRLPSRFNTTHTIGDVYDFVARANAGSAGRAYVLATTFPTKELTDKSQVLGDLAEFKRGGVVVQKWQ